MLTYALKRVGLAIVITAMSLVSGALFRRGRWKTKRV